MSQILPFLSSLPLLSITPLFLPYPSPLSSPLLVCDRSSPLSVLPSHCPSPLSSLSPLSLSLTLPLCHFPSPSLPLTLSSSGPPESPLQVSLPGLEAHSWELSST
ncbi:hypothetical protein E2C01_084455 [Portunus trituberculatus]|uniref:Uncharacterized protein n=1 Tax=Portunus trituberculatus TaxID=210409 RepID=A0A5B7J426_PORTR|nr:hypothetical protein [Portunus trituberculatus]